MDSAAANGDIEKIKLLLAEGVNVDDKNNKWGSTPLMFAVQNSGGSSSTETVQLLLDAGANVNAVTIKGTNALIFAAQSSPISIDSIKLLLNAGANVNDANKEGYTALMFAAGNLGPSSIETVKLLLDAGANVNAAANNGFTALMYAAQSGLRSIETVKLLLDAGVNINATNSDGYTALIIATQNSNTTSSLDTVKLLLEYGANVNAADNTGSTALMFAADTSNSTSSLDTVKLLLEYGANVNAADNTGFTALMFASKRTNTTSSLDTVKLLLDYGADVNAINTIGSSALRLSAKFADRYSSIDTVKLLLDYGANPFINMDELDVPVIKLIEEYQWKSMYNNIQLKAKQFSKSENIPEDNITLPYDVWELILLRQKQQWLCKNLQNSDNKNILLGFAEMLEIPIPENITKPKLCTIISEQLAWGGKYSPDSAIYSNKRYNNAKEDIIRLAYRLGIDTHQPINKILDEIGMILQ